MKEKVDCPSPRALTVEYSASFGCWQAEDYSMKVKELESVMVFVYRAL